MPEVEALARLALLEAEDRSVLEGEVLRRACLAGLRQGLRLGLRPAGGSEGGAGLAARLTLAPLRLTLSESLRRRARRGDPRDRLRGSVEARPTPGESHWKDSQQLVHTETSIPRHPKPY